MPDIENLEGTKLENGWVVTNRVNLTSASTGGAFSYGYEVENDDGRSGFLKAFDISVFFRDPSKALESFAIAANAYLFERNLLQRCQELRIKNIVQALDSGQVNDQDIAKTLFYIIFELAECDARIQLSRFDRKDFKWMVTALHDITLALAGLHAQKIYHQDLKPSNVLVFDGGQHNKVADLGRSHASGVDSPHYHMLVAGLKAYAPPELMYHAVRTDLISKDRCDLYQIGSMILFLFTGAMATPRLMEILKPEYRYHLWTGNYEDVLPYLVEAHTQTCSELEAQLLLDIEPHFYSKIGAPLLDMYRALASPDPLLRGDRKFRTAKYMSSNSLQPYVSRLDHMRKNVAIMERLNAKSA